MGRPPRRAGRGSSSPRWWRRASTARCRAMYVVGENPLLSEPDLHHATKAIAQLDCLVVQDLFMHETAELGARLPARGGVRREGGHLHQLRAPRAARARRGAAARRGAPRLVDHRRARQARGPAPRPRRRPPVRLSAARPRSSTRWRGSSPSWAASPTRGSIARAGCSGRVPTRGPPGHAATSTPIRFRAASARFVPARADRRAAAELPDPGLPVRAQHGTAALSLARRHHHPPRRGAARAGAAPRGGAPSGGRAPARRGDRRPDPRLVATRRARRATRASPRRCARAPSSSPSSSSPTRRRTSSRTPPSIPSSKIPEYKVCAVRIEAIRAAVRPGG